MAETNDTIPYGYCQCGCGRKTIVASKTDNARGWIKGQQLKFVKGHWTKETRTRISKVIHYPQKWRNGKLKREHVLIAENALGKPLPPEARIHHHGPILDQCLVICQDRAYHRLIHHRTRAYNECGNANWEKCEFCKHYDDPGNLRKRTLPKDRNLTRYWHRQCANLFARIGHDFFTIFPEHAASLVENK